MGSGPKIPMISPNSISIPFYESELAVAMLDGNYMRNVDYAGVANHFGWGRVAFIQTSLFESSRDQINKVCLRQIYVFFILK